MFIMPAISIQQVASAPNFYWRRFTHPYINILELSQSFKHVNLAM